METPVIDNFKHAVYDSESKGEIEATKIVLEYDVAEALRKELFEVELQARRADYLEAEMEKYQKFLSEREKEEGKHPYGRNDFERMSSLLSHYENQRNKAMNLLGALVEHQCIAIQAMLLIVKQCHGLTHRQQSARMDVLESTMTEAINNLLQEKSQDWEYMGLDWFNRKDWDFRKLVAENQRLKFQVEEYQKATPIE